LKNLNFQDNPSFNVNISAVLCQFSFLQNLYIQQTSIDGSIPSCVSVWSDMKNLIIENTRMSGEIPSEIFTLSQLVSLHVALSSFSGAIPDKFDSLPYLEDAFFAGTKGQEGFVDPLPSSLFRRGSIQSLSIQFCSFNGPLPDLSEMTSLAAFDFSNNVHLSTPFPGEILTKLWAVPPISQNVLRSLHFDFTPVYGTIPYTSTPFQQMNQQNGFSFTHSSLTGYIPNSTISWVNNAETLKNLVQDCPRLLQPVMPWVEPLVGSASFTGLAINVNGISSQTQIFSMDGGQMINVSVSDQLANFPSSVLQCGFCIAPSAANCTSTSLSSLNVQQLNQILLLSEAAIVGGGLVSCRIPTGISISSPGLGVYYKGPGYGPSYLTEIFCLSTTFLTMAFYNPKPYLSYISPSYGRPEGCSLVTVFGRGFLNAPNATLLLAESVFTATGTIINDTAATFYIPLAKGAFSDGQHISVAFLSTGSPAEQSISTASYTFNTTCHTPLVPCLDGYADPEHCPTPLCRCNSAGRCNYNASTPGIWSCGCQLGFGGRMCQECSPNYFGPLCDKCPCDLEHGTCDWGLNQSGSCTCNSYFIGSDCNVSVMGLGFGGAVAIGAIIAAVVLLRKRRQAKQLDQELLVNQH
jgi:hypothetical protein